MNEHSNGFTMEQVPLSVKLNCCASTHQAASSKLLSVVDLTSLGKRVRIQGAHQSEVLNFCPNFSPSDGF